MFADWLNGKSDPKWFPPMSFVSEAGDGDGDFPKRLELWELNVAMGWEDLLRTYVMWVSNIWSEIGCSHIGSLSLLRSHAQIECSRCDIILIPIHTIWRLATENIHLDNIEVHIGRQANVVFVCRYIFRKIRDQKWSLIFPPKHLYLRKIEHIRRLSLTLQICQHCIIEPRIGVIESKI